MLNGVTALACVVCTIHLWDPTVGRELLVIPLQPDNQASSLAPDGSRGVWFDGTRVVVPHAKGWQVFDGTPLGP